MYSDVNHVVTLGYGVLIPTPPPPPTPTVTPPAVKAPPVDFVQLSGGMFVQKIKTGEIQKLPGSEMSELAEMMELYSRWKVTN